VGYDALKNHVQHYSPQELATAAGVSLQDLKAAADMLTVKISLSVVKILWASYKCLKAY
jgi:anaerobic selenocysteine-containing dehydrogenase